MKQINFIILFILILSTPISALAVNATPTPWIENLNHPWAMVFLPSNNVLVTQRTGQLRLIKNDVLQKLPVKGLPRITANGQGGLMDIELHPNFDENRFVYLTAVIANAQGVGTEVLRGKLSNDETVLEDIKSIFKLDPKLTGNLHFGSRMAFDNNGFLFVTFGDRYKMHESQNLKNHLGTIIRINDDGTIPADNPFVNTPNARGEIYSYGHRNPQGLTKHPVTGAIWSHEHGPKGGDEVNIIEAGKNYGWPEITYGIDYSGRIISDKTHMEGMEQPILHWTPSIAPSGMTFYTGDHFPEWKNHLLVGALAHRHLRLIKLDGQQVIEQQELFRDLRERIRDITMGPDGNLYMLSDSLNGKIYKILPGE